MSRKLLTASIVVLGLSTAVHAQGQRYFVSGAVGVAGGRLDGPYNEVYRDGGHDATGAVRVGAMWQDQLGWGIEAGYVDLGTASEQYVVYPANVNSDVRTRGLLVGGNVSYRFDAPWYLSARGGWLHAWTQLRTRVDGPYVVGNPSIDASGNGWYLGVGGGYDINEQLSIGLHDDLYRVRTSGGGGRFSGYRETVTLQLEYRY